MASDTEPRTSGTDRLSVRPLVQEDGRAVGLLMQEVCREFGAEPLLSVEATVQLFNTPWLERGAGLMLEDSTTIAGYGWARDSAWNGSRYVQVGLFLRNRYRAPASFQILTTPLLELARDISQRYHTPAALTYYRSVDTAHVAIVRAIGFSDMPVAMVGFRHDLKHIPEPRPPAGLSIRPARLPEEKSLLLSLNHQAFDNAAIQGEPLHEQYFDLLPSLAGFEPEQILIAELDRQPVGHAVLHFQPDKPHCGPELCEVAVLPKHRGRGIGPTLVHRLLVWCRSRGVGTVFTGSFSTNPAAAMYWRLGFRPDPIRTYFFFTKNLTDN
ncbi:MAG: GNAT family N-acetyltransferase [candidate division WOR-3 bacterium]